MVEMASTVDDLPVDWSPRTTIVGNLMVSLMPNVESFWLRVIKSCACSPRIGGAELRPGSSASIEQCEGIFCEL